MQRCDFFPYKYGFPYFPTSEGRPMWFRVDPSFFILLFFEEGGGCLVGYCMMIEIVQMALSYYLNKLRKDCFLKHHGRNDPESAARARGAICSQDG